MSRFLLHSLTLQLTCPRYQRPQRFIDIIAKAGRIAGLSQARREDDVDYEQRHNMLT